MKRTFVLGNGESRKGLDLNNLKEYGTIYGCNALYRDFTPDGLIAVDWAIMHEIYASGYAQNNPCYFRQWNKIPAEMYFFMMKTDIATKPQDYLNEKLREKGWPTVDHFVKETERTDEQEFVLHGIHFDRLVDRMEYILTHFSDLSPEEVKWKLGNAGLWVSWIKDNDCAYDIDDHLGQEVSGSSAGPVAVNIACHNEQPDECFLVGFDMYSNTDTVNNMYKDTNCYIAGDCRPIQPVNWIKDHRENFHKYTDTKFYRVMPNVLGTDKVSSFIEEWRDCDNIEYISIDEMKEILDFKTIAC